MSNIYNPSSSQPSSTGTPYLLFTSSTNDPTNKVLTITSLYPFGFRALDSLGHFLASWNTQDGYSPLQATYNFANIISYPNLLTLEIYDGATWQILNTQTIQVFGGDVFNCKLTYPPDNPSSQGYADVSVDGVHMMINLQELPTLIFNSSDVHFGEQGGPTDRR
jgi:hypothetical protein